MKFLMDTNIFLEVLLEQEKMGDVIVAARQFNLDFDDACRYIAAQRYGLTIVHFDADFDYTERGRKTPQELLF